ncbi:tetratricopeptide repeat protein [Rhodanobacter sp. Si-c]|uniref:Tetratricopeptide repeat protein n=1 Tax=Rhodanobacter lycopersici TaxID=3162487 RepID=A0ABV3QB30_9GAMM
MEEFLARLKAHKLVQWTLGYIAVSFAMLPVLDIVAERFGWSQTMVRCLIIAIGTGFFVALVIAWYHGERGEQRVTRTEHAILATLVVLGGLAMWRIGPAAPKATEPAQATAPRQVVAPARPAAFDPPADTLVVLPFANESGDPKQQYFSDGITEELTNAIGQNTALRVIAWDTASHYRDSTQPATAIGKVLDVANVLTGKILREGNEIRVIVELVNARTGFQVWSSHYDDLLANVFQVQDQITAAIAGALKVKFASLGAARTVNPQAHDLVLQAIALGIKARTAAPLEQARKLLEQAIALDPDYADAHAGLAGAWFVLTQYSTLPLKDALPKVREEAHKALALDPRNVNALVALANADVAEGKLAEARAGYEHALALDPSNANAHLDYGNVLPLKSGLAQYLEAVQLDPDNATAQNNLVAQYLDLGEYAQALAPAQALMRLDPTSADSALGLAQIYSLLHRSEDAVKAFDLAQPDTELAKALVAAGRLTYQSLLDPALHAQAVTAVEALRRRADLDPDSMGDVIQLELALGQNPIALEQLPKLCAASPVICSDLSLTPAYLPLRGDPRFQQLVRQYDTVSKPAAAATAAPATTAGPSP